MQGLDDLTAGANAVVDSGEAVQHAAAGLDGLLDAVFAFFVAVLAGVRVDGGGQQVSLALVLQIGQQLDVLLQQSDAGAGLDQGLAVLLGVDQLLGEVAVFGHSLVVIDGFLQVDILTGGPLGQNFFTQCVEFALGDLLILDIHLGSAPFS